MIYKTKAFEVLLKKDSLADEDLVAACEELNMGLFDAGLGGNLYKKRIACDGKGKRGGYRTVIGARIGVRYVFLYVFTKSQRANISPTEKRALKLLARTFLDLSEQAIALLVANGQLIEVQK